MPRYFFDLDDGRQKRTDEVGRDLPDLAAVRREAMKLLPQIAFEISHDGDRQTVVIVARDRHRNAVYSATLSYVGEMLGPPG